jgi:hypothetical protein
MSSTAGSGLCVLVLYETPLIAPMLGEVLAPHNGIVHLAAFQVLCCDLQAAAHLASRSLLARPPARQMLSCLLQMNTWALPLVQSTGYNCTAIV